MSEHVQQTIYLRGDPIHESFFHPEFGTDHGLCRLRREGSVSSRREDPLQNDRLPDRGQADPRQALRGLPLLLQFPLPAQARLLRRCRTAARRKGPSTMARACSSMDPTRLFTDAQSTQEWRKKEFFSVTDSTVCERPERLDHDPAAVPQDEKPEKHRGVPAGSGRSDLLGKPEELGGIPGKTSEPRHALRLSAAQAGRVRDHRRLAGSGRERA